MFDARIFTFSIFTNCHDINIIVKSFVPFKRSTWTNVSIKVELSKITNQMILGNIYKKKLKLITK